MTSSRELQQRIDWAEVQHTSQNDADESYAQTTLGTVPTTSVGTHKVLGVPWNPTSDCLIFDVAELARLASDLQPTK